MSAALTKLRMQVLSDPANLAEVRRTIEKLCLDNGVEQTGCDEIGLCVNEAMANVIRHAYSGATDKPIEVSAEVEADAVRVRIRDWGNGVNPMDLPQAAPDPLTPGGLGMICLRKMMGRVVFTPQPDGMLLEMTRKKKSDA